MLHPEDRDRVLAQLEDALRAGEPFVAEYRMVKGDGRVIWVHDEAREVRDERGKPVCLQGILFDVTERRQAESLALAQRDLAVKLSQMIELDEAMGLCLSSALTVSDMECGGIYLADPRSGDLHMVAHTGLSPEFAASVGDYRRDSPNGELVHGGKPIYGLHDTMRLELDDIRRREGLRALGVIPIRHEGRVIACLNVSSRHMGEVPFYARAALETIAAQTGMAISRLRSEREEPEAQGAAPPVPEDGGDRDAGRRHCP